MALNSKAKQIGAVLQALAYHDFEFLGMDVYIRDYDPGQLADEKALSTAAEKQTEQHLLLHHGLPSGDGADVRDDWCFECTRQFISHWLGSWWDDILAAAQKSGSLENLMVKEMATTLTMNILRFLDKDRADKMREATHAVRVREGLGPAHAEDIETLLKSWEDDDDRVTDFYAEWLGKRFPAMIDRAEALNAIPARKQVPEPVQRYLVEASRCYVFGQYVACLVVCRAAIEIALGDFLDRNGKKAALHGLQDRRQDGLAARIAVAESLDKW